MGRRQELENLIIKCCESSAVYAQGRYQSVKYVCGKGLIVFFEQSRMIDLCEVNIPDYNPDVDDRIISEIAFNSENIMGSESHKYNDNYSYTLSLKNNK